MAKKEKKEVTTLQHLRRWKAANTAIRAGMYLCPVVPTGIVMGLNWQEWFCKDASQGWSIGIGFSMLLVAFLSAIVGMVKKDDVLRQKLGGFLYLAVLFAVIGVSLKLLSNILGELGNYFLYIAASLLGSVGCSTLSDKWSGEWVKFYSGIAEENGLTSPAAKRKAAKEQAAREAAERESKVDML